MRTSLLAFVAIAFISCNPTDGGRPYKSNAKIFAVDPDINGKITRIDLKRVGTDSLFKVLVEENPGDYESNEPEGHKIDFMIWGSTEIFILRENGNVYYTNKENLKAGQKVNAWLMNGPVLTSYPLQGGARQILILEE